MNTEAYKIYLDGVIQRVENARISRSEHHIVKIVAVSKYSDEAEIKALYQIGQRAFGENKVQDLLAKSTNLNDLPLEWHFIGTLQKNKINQLIDADPFLFQSLDSLELAQALQQRLKIKEARMECLLQINSAKEESKSGVMPEIAADIYAQIKENCPNITLRGVMSIGAHTQDQKIIQESFETTYGIFKGLKGADICSMGMSGDFELAIRCGSNMVRLGSIIFPK
ncbi:MAG: YggS family pyridoxal phosphate-dependent enzyme [Campylobacterales bacterium]|nr:YggS family pyridoxal phosphate-dependent enzyme [Campylobacterales bacterium]